MAKATPCWSPGITPPGQTLTLTVDVLRVWAETHIEEVLAAQKRYDARHAVEKLSESHRWQLPPLGFSSLRPSSRKVLRATRR